MDARERRVLRTVELRAEARVSDLAHQTGFSDQVVRYHLRRLIKQKTIKRSILVNYSRLGLQRLHLFIGLDRASQQDRETFAERVREMPNLCLLAAVGGQYDFQLAFLAKNTWEIGRILEEVAAGGHGRQRARALLTVQRTTNFGTKLLDPLQENSFLDCVETPRRATVDDLDLAILQILAEGEYTSFREVGRKLGVAASKVDYRIRALERDGVIAGHYYQINDRKGSSFSSFVILGTLSTLSGSVKEELVAFSSSHPSIAELVQCIGEHDFQITAKVRSAEEVEALRGDLYERFKDSLGDLQVLPYLGTLFHSDFPAVIGPDPLRRQGVSFGDPSAPVLAA